jgi:hypothetical protein
MVTKRRIPAPPGIEGEDVTDHGKTVATIRSEALVILNLQQ